MLRARKKRFWLVWMILTLPAAEGDKVVVRATNTCAQESFFGIPRVSIGLIFDL